MYTGTTQSSHFTALGQLLYSYSLALMHAQSSYYAAIVWYRGSYRLLVQSLCSQTLSIYSHSLAYTAIALQFFCHRPWHSPVIIKPQFGRYAAIAGHCSAISLLLLQCSGYFTVIACTYSPASIYKYYGHDKAIVLSFYSHKQVVLQLSSDIIQP